MSEADLAAHRARRASAPRSTRRQPDWNDGDWAFHEALYRPSRHDRQIDMIRSLRMTSDLYAAAHRALPKERKRWLADHRAIVAPAARRQTAGPWPR